MSLDVTLILFQIVVLVFALSVHAAVQAYANFRLGDPTAMMVGRVTLNPLVQLEPWGSILMPALSLFLHGPILGWGRPVPVTPRNFKRIRRDEVLASGAALLSFLAMAILGLVLLVILKHIGGGGASVFSAMAMAKKIPVDMSTLPSLFPFALLLYYLVVMNVLLFVFNLIPVPPLDGSRILRSYLPYNLEKMYDRIGMLGSFIMFTVALNIVIPIFYPPLLRTFDSLLLSF